MPVRSIPDLQDTSASQDRRNTILDASECCFVRAGFHRTTMQDVAAEAGMSPGNLYRYFPSKDAIVVALAERDRARIGEDFTAASQTDDFLAIFRELAHKHFAEEPRERAILCLEIWAEATRNPAFSSITEEFDREIFSRMTALFRQGQDTGAIAPGVDIAALARLITTLADGLFVRRAITRDFDGEREAGTIIAVIEAAFAGRINLDDARATSLAPKEIA